MDTPQQIQAEHRNGNLHVNLHGHFTPETAGELTSAIARTYPGKGNIFIHTTRLTSVAPDAKQAFGLYAGSVGLPWDNVYLTGSKGLEISPDRGKVIVHEKKKTGCCGRCRDCSCHEKTDAPTGDL